MSAVASASRFALGAPLALGATLGLAVLMQSLVAVGEVSLERAPPPPLLNIVTRIIDTPPDRKVVPVKPELVEPPPINDLRGGSDVERGLPPIVTDRGPEVVAPPPPGAVFAAQPARRLFTPLPVYPSNANGREGVCTVRFDVNAAGRVQNAQATSCSSGVFARAAEETVSRSVYQPAMGEDGPIATIGLTLEVAFQMTE